MSYERLEKIVEKFIKWLELLLAVIIIITVLIEALYISVEVFSLITNPKVIDHSREVLGRFLILVVGLEFAVMLMRRNPQAIIDIVILAVSRKIILEDAKGYEGILSLFSAVLAICLLFLIRRYIFFGSSRQL